MQGHRRTPPPPLLLSAPQNERAYAVLRLERMNVRMAGVRAKRAAEAAQAEKDA